MEIFEILEIEPTTDKDVIKQAYRRLLPKFHPEDDPKGFQRLREAFDAAMKYEEKELTVTMTAIDVWMKKIAELYDDFEKRLNVECWKELLDDDVSFSLDTAEEANYELLIFLASHFYVPHEVWAILGEHFAWKEKRQELYEQFPEDFIDYIIANGDYEDSFRYYLFDIQPDKDYDRFIGNYFYLTKNIYDDEAEGKEQRLEESILMGIKHPDFTILRIRYEIINNNTSLAKDLCAELLEEYQDISSWYSAARLEFMLNNPEKAKYYSYKILENDPTHAGAYITIADSLFKEEAYECAIENYEKAAELIPYDVYINNAIFNSYSALAEKYKEIAYTSADTSERMQYFNYAVRIRNFDEALKISQTLDLSSINLYDYHDLLGETFSGLERFEEAAEHFKEALNYASLEDKEGVYADYGLQFTNMERYDEAIEKYDEGLALHKDSIILTYRKAAAKIKLEKYSEAIELCNKILSKRDVPNAYHFKAEALYFLGEYEEALENCNQALQIEKYYISFLLKMNIYLIIKQYESIIEIAEYLQSSDLGTDEVILLKIKALNELRRYEEAKNDVNILLEKEPENYEAQYQLARILYGEKNYEGALRCLEKAESGIEDKRACLFLYGNIYLYMNLNDNAEQVYLKLLETDDSDYVNYWLGYVYDRKKQYNEAIQYYKKAIEINPNHYYANGDLADVYQLLKDIDNALYYNQKQLDINPTDYFYVQRGNLYGRKNDYDKQLENFHKALELNPNNSFAHNNAGVVCMKRAEYERASEYFIKSIESDHPYKHPYLDIGICLLKLKRFDEAVKWLNEGLIKFPDEALFNKRIANIYFFRQSYDDAIEYYKRSLRIEKNVDDYIKIGRCYKQMKNFEKAMKFYNIAIELDKKSSDIFKDMGDLFYDNNNYRRAIYYYKKALKLNQTSGYTPLSLGKSYMKLGKKSKADEYYKIAMKNYMTELETDDIIACDYKNVGDVYFELGDYAAAIEYYNKALRSGIYYKFCNGISCYDAYFGLGKIYEKMCDYENALLNFTKANEIYERNKCMEAIERVSKEL